MLPLPLAPFHFARSSGSRPLWGAAPATPLRYPNPFPDNRRSCHMTPRQKSFPELADWTRENETVTRMLGPYVRGLVRHGAGRRPEVWASSIVTQLRDVPMLLTAKHVLDRSEGIPLLLEAPHGFEQLDLSPNQVRTDPTSDLAIVRLPAEALSWELSFLNLAAQCEARERPCEIAMYAAQGFPEREASVHVDRTRVELVVVAHWSFEHATACEDLGRPVERFIAVGFDRERAYQDGFVRAMKLPHGMSGGALWRVCGFQNGVPEDGVISLAGVLIEQHYPEVRCLLATRVEVCFKLAQGFW